VRWVKKYQTSQSIGRKDRVNVAYKINKQHINQILSENVKSIIKEIPTQTYHKLFIGSYQRSETYKPKKSRKKTLKKYKE